MRRSWLSCTFFPRGRFQRTGAERADRLDDSLDVLDEAGRHGGREVHHLEPLGADADLVEDLANAAGSLARPEIALQEVAAAFQAPGHQDPVDALLEGVEDVFHFDLAGARRVDDAHVGGILHALGARQVGRGIGAVVAAKGDDPRLPAFGYGGARGFFSLRLNHAFTPATSNSSSMATRALSSWCWRVMVRAGQEAAQVPHPMHLAPWISALLRSLILGAP